MDLGVHPIWSIRVLKNLSMDQLRSFVTVTQLGGYTQAASVLGRTQPAISLQMKKLEDTIGQPLFQRDPRGLALTSAGQSLLEYARRILQLNDEALQHLSGPTLSGRIQLGLPSEFASTLLPNILGRFAKAYPQVTLEVTTALSRQLMAKPLQQQLDLTLTLHDKSARRQPGHLKTEQLVWVGNQSFTADTSRRIPLVVAPEGCMYRQRALQQLRKHRLEWQLVYTNPDLTGIQAAIEAGLGITVLARSTVPARLRILDDGMLPALGTIGIRLAFPQRGRSEATAVLADFIRSSL